MEPTLAAQSRRAGQEVRHGNSEENPFNLKQLYRLCNILIKCHIITSTVRGCLQWDIKGAAVEVSYQCHIPYLCFL